jgi:chromate transporter
MGVNEIFVLFGAGLLGILLYFMSNKKGQVKNILPIGLLQVQMFAGDLTNLKIFLTFLKVGSILYGSGYVLFAFLDAELVSKGLLTKQQLTDAVAVGQFTPGPVFSAATFIGWQLAGIDGAIAATVGIFLPAFLFVGFLNPLIPLLRKSRVMSAFLDTVNVAAIAIILSVAYEMARASVTDWRTLLIAVLSLLLTFVFKKLNTAFIIVGGAMLGYLLSFV